MSDEKDVEHMAFEYQVERMLKLEKAIQRVMPYVPEWAHEYLQAEYLWTGSDLTRVLLHYANVKVEVRLEWHWFRRRALYVWTIGISGLVHTSYDLETAMGAALHENRAYRAWVDSKRAAPTKKG
jgi:hypothetical protein